MSNQGGIFFFTATPELAQAMPKVFKRGATYTAQRASAVIDMSGKISGRRVSSSSKTPNKTEKKSKAPVTASKDAKRGIKTTKTKAVSTEMVVQFVRNNAGCNMTQIEAAVKAPQASLRRTLNDARNAGLIRTEGQRRGLRYFATVASVTSSESAAPEMVQS